MRSLRLIFRETGLLFFATLIANIANGLFQLIMGRMLSAAQFGILTALLSIFLVLSVPLTALQTLITKHVAGFKATSGYAEISRLALSSLKFLLALGLLLAILLTAGSGYMSAFLKVDSVAPIFILAGILFLSLILPVARGILQGMQEFNSLGLNLMADTTLRLVTAILLVSIGFGASGALLGSVAGAAVALALVVSPLTRLLGIKQEVNLDLKKIYRFFWPTLTALFLLTLIISQDVVIVKHFFSPKLAGYYAAAVTMGKVVLFFPAAISLVMFSKSAEQHALEKDTLPDLKRYLIWTGIMSGTVTFIYFIVPKQIMLLIGFGKYLSVAPLVGIIGVAMTFFALNNVLFLYQLSVHRFGFIRLLVLAAVAQAIFMWSFHSSLLTVALILLVNGSLLFATNFVIVFQSKKLSALLEKLMLML